MRLGVQGPRENRSTLESLLESEVDQLIAQIKPHVIGRGSHGLAHWVLNALKERGETLAVAESCTGGLVASMITSIPGSSQLFQGGVVAYSNEVKQSQLRVTSNSLAQHGAGAAGPSGATTAWSPHRTGVSAMRS